MVSDIIDSFNEVVKIDSDFSFIVNKYGMPKFKEEKNDFKTLMKIIISQQISRKAAESIYKRLINSRILSTNDFLNCKIEILKKMGLSDQKIEYISNLAIKIKQKEIDLELFKKMSTEFVFNSLVKIKGIGKWTINNYQLFVLKDLNAWPGGDLAVQESIKILKGLKKRPNEKEADKFAENWKPYRGSAALLLWHFKSKRMNND